MSHSKTIYDFTVRDLAGTEVPLDTYRGYVVLIVNTASKCGFTPQLKGLEEIFQKYKDRKFVVLGFPSNDFLGQEPLENKDIQRFCTNEYGTSFPLFDKNPVSGDAIQPLFAYLTSGGGDDDLEGRVKWNFEKFLVGRDGVLKKRYGSITGPTSSAIVTEIERLLAE